MSINSMIPEAHFDCLQIAGDLAVPLGGVTRLELQRIAFLACLLSIYTSQPVSDWGYKFANTGSGLPYSDHLATATEFLINTGALVEEAGRLLPSARGRELLRQLRSLHSMSARRPCVDAAAASLLAVPGSVMADGLQQEPTMRASELRSSPTMLLDEPHLQTLHDHFAALATVIPPGDTDLLSPSVLWLTYMAHESEAVDRKTGDGPDREDDDSGPPRGGAPLHPGGGDGGPAYEALADDDGAGAGAANDRGDPRSHAPTSDVPDLDSPEAIEKAVVRIKEVSQ